MLQRQEAPPPPDAIAATPDIAVSRRRDTAFAIFHFSRCRQLKLAIFVLFSPPLRHSVFR
jgi:hypothetical protein